jgi:hypothetical protein
LSEWLPRSANSIPDPTTKSFTVWETNTPSLGRSSHHPGGDMDGDAPHAPIQHLDLTGVKAGSDLDPQRPDGIGKLRGTPHSPRGAVEGGQEAITDRLDLFSAEAVEVCTYQLVVGFPQVEPPLVS